VAELKYSNGVNDPDGLDNPTIEGPRVSRDGLAWWQGRGMGSLVDRMLPGRRGRDESGRDYLTRLASGPGMSGPLVGRELARELLRMDERLAAVEQRLVRLEGER
jgi:hypothetical protein